MKSPSNIWSGWLPAGLIALASAVAYANTLSVPLLADDLESIGMNPTIRRLWPLSGPLHPPGYGMTVQGRPVLNLSLALNYAISGTGVWSYHVVNWLIHVLAALVLFGILRRGALRFARARAGGSAAALEPPGSVASGNFAAAWALAVALIWAVHPLQTEAVTYLVQRAESLMGLLYLVTFYGFLRAVDRGDGGEIGHESDRRWLALSVAACLLGMGTKEVMVSAPVIVFAYDCLCVAGSFSGALRRRWGYYLALAATWIPLAILAVHSGARGGASGPGPGLTFGRYWLTQPSAIVHYLRLAVWPVDQVFYAGAIWVESVRAIIPELLAVAALLALTGLALVRARRPGSALVGFLGLWFFAVLAPTSLVPGRSVTLAEHRMYLALIPCLVAVASAAACLARPWIRRRGGKAVAAIGLVLAAPCAVATFERNAEYGSAVTLYAHDAAVMPASAVAQTNLGTAYLREGRFAEAASHLQSALRLGPPDIVTEHNLGNALAGEGRLREAESHYRAAMQLSPGRDFDTPLYDLFAVLCLEGRSDEARQEMDASLRANPDRARLTLDLARGWVQTGLVKRALVLYQALVDCFPDSPAVRSDFGNALTVAGRGAEAIGQYREALRLRPSDPVTHYDLALALLADHRPAEARAGFAEALRLQPGFVQAQRMLEAADSAAGPLAAPMTRPAR